MTKHTQEPRHAKLSYQITEINGGTPRAHGGLAERFVFIDVGCSCCADRNELLAAQEHAMEQLDRDGSLVEGYAEDQPLIDGLKEACGQACGTMADRTAAPRKEACSK